MKVLISISLIFLILGCNSNSQKEVDSEKSDSLNYRAKFFLETGQYDSASDAIDEALIWDANNWAAYNNRAILEGRTGHTTGEVVADFERALRLKPNYEITLYSLANYYEDIKDYGKALQACDNYIKFSYENDFDSVDAIYRLQNRCQRHIEEANRVVDGISVTRALAFYDSVNTVISEAVPIEQRFIDKLTHSRLDFAKNNSISSIDVAGLKKGLDSARKANQLKIEKIGRITEVDSSIGYKRIVLSYASLFNNAFKGIFRSYIDDLSTKNIFIIVESSDKLMPILKKIKQAEIRFKQAQKEFHGKYGF